MRLGKWTISRTAGSDTAAEPARRPAGSRSAGRRGEGDAGRRDRWALIGGGRSRHLLGAARPDDRVVPGGSADVELPLGGRG